MGSVWSLLTSNMQKPVSNGESYLPHCALDQHQAKFKFESSLKEDSRSLEET